MEHLGVDGWDVEDLFHVVEVLFHIVKVLFDIVDDLELDDFITCGRISSVLDVEDLDMEDFDVEDCAVEDLYVEYVFYIV